MVGNVPGKPGRAGFALLNVLADLLVGGAEIAQFLFDRLDLLCVLIRIGPQFVPFLLQPLDFHLVVLRIGAERFQLLLHLVQRYELGGLGVQLRHICPPRRSEWHADRQRLPDTSDNPAKLPQAHDEHHRPVPQQPVAAPRIRAAKSAARHRERRSGNNVHSEHGALAADDAVPAQLDLHEHLDHAPDQDEPQQPESGLRPGGGGGDQLAGTHDRAGNNQARAKAAENTPHRARGRFVRLHLAQVIVPRAWLFTHEVRARAPLGRRAGA